MSSLPSFDLPVPGTSSSLVSYRRAQTFFSGSNIPSRDEAPEYWDAVHDEEAGSPHEYDDLDEPHTSDVQTPQPTDLLDPLWDDSVQASPAATLRNETNEHTPLLMNKQISFQSLRRTEAHLDRRPTVLNRRYSNANSIDVKYHYGGKSTFGQTLFNSIAILVGIGMLSEPLAFAYAGWGVGTALIIFYGFITCYTAKILASIVLSDPKLRTYADIGYKAFGRRSTGLISCLFCLELFSLSVVLTTLYADSLHLVLPILSSNQYKLLGLLVIIPTVMMPLSILSFTSILGILSTVLLITCIFIDGFSKLEAPGSLWQPAETSWSAMAVGKLGVAFGLFMAGFSGHAVVPSLAKDMADPSHFNTMINWAFGIATIIYGIIGAAGYLMFGRTVSQEISQDILATPGYSAFLNRLAVWMLVIAPLSKFALSTRPLNLTIEVWLGIDEPAKPTTPSRPPSPISKNAATLGTSPRSTPRPWVLVVERSALAALAAAVSILIPEFSTVMAFLGSFSAFVLCVIGPICAKVALERQCAWHDGALLITAVVMAVWGTFAAFS